MLFKQNEQFNNGELLLLKTMLSGVGYSELKGRLPHHENAINELYDSLLGKRISDEAIEDYLGRYVSIVTAKHSAVRKQKYDQASEWRNEENHYLDMSYSWLFTDDFSDRNARRTYARYAPEPLIDELDHYLNDNYK